MSYTQDPANRLWDRIRWRVGDTDLNEEGLADAEYEFIISNNTVNGVVDEGACYVEALNLLVAKYAKYVTETAGRLSVKYSDIYKHYKELLRASVEDPTSPFYAVKSYEAYAGGIYADQINSNKDNPNTVGAKLFKGWTHNDQSRYK